MSGVLTGFESDFADEDPFVLELQLHHEMLSGAILQVDMHYSGVLGHSILLRFVGDIVFLPPFPF